MNDSSFAWLGLDGYGVKSVIRVICWMSGLAQSFEDCANAREKSCAEVSGGLRAETDYSREGLGVSSAALGWAGDSLRGAWTTAALTLLVMAAFVMPAPAQYPGRITKTDKDKPVLRSIAVLEWVGDSGKPSASRLVPVTVYDGEQLNDGTIYLTRPAPLALAGGVEYELQSAGKPTGVFDVFSAGEINGAWEGFGVWKSLSVVEAAKAKNSFNTSTLYGSREDGESDEPVLHRKHPKGTDSDDGGSAPGGDSSSKQASQGSSAGSSSGASDPDRPTLKRKASEDSSAGNSSGSGSSTASSGNVDPDRPTLRRSHKSSDSGMETSNAPPDPDRPRLRHGKPEDLAAEETPKLMGFPPTMQQVVAVSDADSHAEHPWKYTWANLDDEAKFRTSLEAMARTALGMDAPPPPAAPAKKTAQTKKAAKTPLEPPAPAPLAEEQFRVFELTYGATATMVLTASTPKPPVVTQPDDEPPPPVIKRGKPTASTSATQTSGQSQPVPKAAPQKFVTIIAQPDLYGGIAVLYKSVTDSAHLDETPRMKLVDAVDAMADNRGELLFELRGDGQRQFALFRVLRGSAEQLFATVAIP
jgi:hypothetical protein